MAEGMEGERRVDKGAFRSIKVREQKRKRKIKGWRNNIEEEMH